MADTRAARLRRLMPPRYNGRRIVGWAGVGMLIQSLTGIRLWWPRNGNVLRALRWTRSPRFTFNLHNMLGFWISIPRAVVLPTIFVVTGVIQWLRKRADRKALEAKRGTAQLRPAE